MPNVAKPNECKNKQTITKSYVNVKTVLSKTFLFMKQLTPISCKSRYQCNTSLQVLIDQYSNPNNGKA